MRTTLDDLAHVAADLAMLGAVQWAQQNHRLEVAMLRASELSHVISVEVGAVLPAALDDARLAFDQNMTQVAELIFTLSMTLAGTKAAKLVLET